MRFGAALLIVIWQAEIEERGEIDVERKVKAEMLENTRALCREFIQESEGEWNDRRTEMAETRKAEEKRASVEIKKSAIEKRKNQKG